MSDFNAQIIEEFRSNGGIVGGMFEGATMVLLHTTGARTGRERVNPLVALPQGDRLYVFASAGGSPRHPDWYHNLVANPSVEVEYETDRFPATAKVVEGDERARIYAAQVVRRPAFGDYERATTRVIPVVELVRQA